MSSHANASLTIEGRRHLGKADFHDHTSRPHQCPAQIPDEVIAQIETLRRQRQWSARSIRIELSEQGISISQAIIGWLCVDYEGGIGTTTLARRYGIAESTVYRLIQ